MAATTESIANSPLALPMSAQFDFPNPLSASSDLTAFDPHSYMETSGFNNSVNQAFVPLSNAIQAEFEALQSRLDAFFDDWEAEIEATNFA
jgi:hypothetical protein